MDFDTPKQAMEVIAQINTELHLLIENKIKGLIESRPALSITLREDAFLGYPRVYSEDARCSIPALKKVSINRDGRIHLTTDKNTIISKPHCENLSVSELLQIWDILIQATQNKITLTI